MIEELCDTYYEAINWALAEVRYFRRASGALAAELTARAGEQIAGVHAWLERALGKRSWFNGDALRLGRPERRPLRRGLRRVRLHSACGLEPLRLDGARASSARASLAVSARRRQPWRRSSKSAR